MSDFPSNSPEPSNRNRLNNEPPKTNWGLLGMLAMGMTVLCFAFFSPDSFSGKVQEISLSSLRQLLDRDQVIFNDDKKPVEIITSTSGRRVQGWRQPNFKNSNNGEKKSEPFQVLFDKQISKDSVNSIFGDNVTTTQVEHLPALASGTSTINLADIRKWAAMDEIDKSKPVQIITDGSNSAILEGTRTYSDNTQVIPANAEQAKKEAAPIKFFVKIDDIQGGTIMDELITKGATLRSESNFVGSLLANLLPIIILVLVLAWLFRQQMKSAGRGAMNFGRSKARLLTQEKNKVTFKDVAGIQEAKEELVEIVEFLRDPKKFQRLGGSIPKGVLMVGPPGTGKTLLARAIAGEADVPFFSISGSDFVEMFVGVGASRVRDMFEQGKKNAPCLIFIDEIDAVGRHRGHGMGGGHDEREQTLNQMLVEMDGFDTQEGVIIIAATNRPDVLDPALLRPGRFDRQVTVSLPDVNGREEILRVHVKKIKLEPGTDLSVIARGTPGFSGAELANLINEAALLAARKNLEGVTLAELEEARDKVRWGRERRSLAMSEKERIGTAWHEAGHAFLNIVLKHCAPLHKVTIIPRGPYLGATMYLPDGDKYSTQKKEALDSLVMTMGGRIAEKFHSDDISNGASGDIRQATQLARRMVCEWGMSDKIGMVEYSEGESPVFVARDMGRSRDYSEATAQAIDAEVKKFIDNAFAEAERLLNDNRDKVELIAKALLEYETLDAAHVRDLVEHGKMNNPPPSIKPPPVPLDIPKKESPKPQEQPQKSDDGNMPGEVVGAPA